jgi:amino acid adenylation domain-containing protein
VRDLKAAGARSRASFFTVLFTAYAAFLQRLTGQQDLIVGVPAAGQSASGMENVVGHCVHLLPVRCTIDPAAPFSQCLSQVRSLVLDAYDHQQVTYGDLMPHLKLRRDPSRPPLVSAAFNLDQAVQGKDLPFAGLAVEYRSNARHFETFELFVNASEAGGRVVLECQYNADLFDAETIAGRMASFEALLAGAAAGPDQTVARLPMLSLAQQEETLVAWNATDLDYPRDRTVAELLREQALRTPDRPALTFGSTTLTNDELHRRASRLAHHLATLGAGPGGLVALCLERSVELVMGQLAVLKTGAGYLPLDPKYLRERLGFMLGDSGAALVVTQENLLGLLPPGNIRAVCPARETAAIAARPDTPPPCPARPTDTAYVIYTSGSTGTPKAVVVLHAGVVNFITSMARSPGVGANDVMAAVTTLSFDIAVAEIFLPLAIGAQVVLAPTEATGDGHRLLRLLQSSGATILQGTPATWRMLLQAGWKVEPRLTAWCGGEALPPDLARALRERTRELWNLYSPTETTVWSTAARVTDPDQISIGEPIGNTRCYVLDTHGEPVPIGVPGELYIGGAGVAAGYLRRPELTEQRFVENPYHDPFADHRNPRLYRTGDLVRWRRDGTIEYLGRNDHQVKLRGFRIELGEDEAALTAVPGVRQAVAVVRSDRANDPRLVAYFVPANGRPPTATELRKHLRQRLPESMIPQHFVELEGLPLTANGKVDRGRLPAPFAAPREPRREQTATPAQCYLQEVCREVLGTADLGVEDNFFQAGGHSLLAMQLLARIEKDTGLRLSPRVLLVNTLAQVADSLPASVRPGRR